MLRVLLHDIQCLDASYVLFCEFKGLLQVRCGRHQKRPGILGIDAAGNPFFDATERLGLGPNELIHSVGDGHHTENKLPAATWKRQNQCGCLQKEKMNSQICRLITRMNPHGILAYASTS